VAAARGHRKSLASPIGALATFRGNRHRPFEHEEASVEFVLVLWVEQVGLHPAIDNFAIALLAQFAFEYRSFHSLSP
jgi:hypothetical protein